MFYLILSFLLVISSLCYALPSHAELAPRAVCTPVAGGSADIDDTPAIEEAIASCGSGGTIVIPTGSTYYLNTELSFAGCANCDFQIEGLLKFTDSTSYWSGKTAMILLSNIEAAKIRSLSGDGVIDGNGQDAYDLFAANSSYQRPTLLYITGGRDITVSGFRQKNPPNVFNSIGGGASNVVFTNMELDATSKSDNPAKNTDGFDIGSSSFVTLNDVTVTNDEDCVAFKAGANYAQVNTISCTGSHGISIGSLGKTSADTVKNIYVSGATMINSAKAAGIKMYPATNGGSVTVTNVTLTDFTIDNCDYAIQIQSCYGSDADTCDGEEKGDLTDIVFSAFSGTTSTKYEPVTSNIDCPDDGTCGITISKYDVSPPSGTGEVLCANTPSDLGVTCTSGASG